MIQLSWDCRNGRLGLMKNVLRALLSFLFALFRSRLGMQVEILALRHQLAAYQQSIKRPRLKPADRIFWA